MDWISAFIQNWRIFLIKFELNVIFIASGLYSCFCAFVPTDGTSTSDKNTLFELRVSFIAIGLDECFYPKLKNFLDKFEFNVMMPHNILSINWLQNWHEMLRVVLVQPCALLFLCPEKCAAFLGVVCYLCMFFFY